MTIVVAPDVEQVVIDYLPGALTARSFTVPVASKQTGTGESVAVYRTGGPSPTVITDEPQLTFDVRARSESRAASIVLMVCGIMLSLQGMFVGAVFVHSVTEVGGPANLPDPEFTGARYRWTCQMHVRKSVVA